jgi:hypothetical protein
MRSRSAFRPGPQGTYCDIIPDKDFGKAGDDPKVVVTSSGLATVTVGAKDAVAFTRVDRISSLTDKRRRLLLGENAKRRRDFPPAFLLLDEAPNYAVRMRARAARRFNARRSSSLRPPQTP